MPLTVATTTPGEPEIFASVQGEGPSAGMPVVFCRLSRCNLACVWCDTAYTWHFEGDNRPHRAGQTYERRANQVKLDEREVASRIASLGRKRLVLTGGEPLLQGAPLASVLAHLAVLSPDLTTEVETNGTVAPPPAFDARVSQYNVSPKLAHSGNAPELALPPTMLERWAADSRAAFKFVIAQPSDVKEVGTLAASYGIAPARVWLMPEGTDSETLHARMQWLVPLCLDQGYRLSDRLHIHLFGDTRGT